MVESGEYFVVSVRDYGVGFSEKALLYGAEPFSAEMRAAMTEHIRGLVFPSPQNL